MKITLLRLVDELEAVVNLEILAWNNWQLEERRKIIPRKEGVRSAAANELWECGHAQRVRKIE